MAGQDNKQFSKIVTFWECGSLSLQLIFSSQMSRLFHENIDVNEAKFLKLRENFQKKEK